MQTYFDRSPLPDYPLPPTSHIAIYTHSACPIGPAKLLNLEKKGSTLMRIFSCIYSENSICLCKVLLHIHLRGILTGINDLVIKHMWQW